MVDGTHMAGVPPGHSETELLELTDIQPLLRGACALGRGLPGKPSLDRGME